MPTSHRPISLTSTLCKIFERLATNRLSYVLEKNNLLSNLQVGFRKERCTVEQIVTLQDIINKYLSKRVCTLAVFLDFEKAFDIVWKNGLRIKLKTAISQVTCSILLATFFLIEPSKCVWGCLIVRPPP